MRNDPQLIVSSDHGPELRFHDRGKILFGLGSVDVQGVLHSPSGSGLGLDLNLFDTLVVFYDPIGRRAASLFVEHLHDLSSLSFVAGEDDLDRSPQSGALLRKIDQLESESGWNLEELRVHLITTHADVRHDLTRHALSRRFLPEQIFSGGYWGRCLLDLDTGEFTNAARAGVLREYAGLETQELPAASCEVLSRSIIVERARAFYAEGGFDEEDVEFLSRDSWGEYFRHQRYPVELLHSDDAGWLADADNATREGAYARLDQMLDYMRREELPNEAGITVEIDGEYYTILDTPLVEKLPPSSGKYANLASLIYIIRADHLRIDRSS